MYTILGATGNIGSVIARAVLAKAESVRVVGRNIGRLKPFVQRGAEPFIGDAADAEAMTRAFRGRGRLF